MSVNSGYPKMGDIKEYTTTLNTGDIYMDGTTGNLYPTILDIWNNCRTITDNGLYDSKKLKENEDMRYLYEVILVNPKNDTFYMENIVARSDTSALIEVYDRSTLGEIAFDDLEVSCRRLMEWKKEKSLTKAIKTIQDAVE